MEPDEKTSYSPSEAGKTTRRRFIGLAVGLGGVVAAGVLASRFFTSDQGMSVPDVPEEGDYLGSLDSNIISGGVRKDGIPSIDRPNFVSRMEAEGFLTPDDVVFGLNYRGAVRAYPQRILVWHEIVNDSIDGRRIAITYCPLTGSQIAFEGSPGLVGEHTFGTTGNLVNSNLLMYDRQTDSNWPQILGIAINGPQRGESLSEIPLVWTTWQRWRKLFPETDVLSTDTGHIRDYSSDPYGTRGYYTGETIWFPVMNRSDRFEAKKTVFGLKLGDRRMALPLAELRSEAVRNFSLAGIPLTLFYDSRLDTIRTFKREVEDKSLTFVRQGDKVVDEETSTVWSPEGVAEEGPLQGVALDQVNVFNVMWFAWYAFFPDTEVLL